MKPVFVDIVVTVSGGSRKTRKLARQAAETALGLAEFGIHDAIFDILRGGEGPPVTVEVTHDIAD